MPLYEGLPALIYTAFWPMKLDGRLRQGSLGKKFTLLIDFYDYPPAFTITIKDGDFKITLIEDRGTIPQISKDTAISGKFQEIIEATDSIGSLLKLVLRRKLRVKGKRHLFTLLKIINVKQLKGSLAHPNGEGSEK